MYIHLLTLMLLIFKLSGLLPTMSWWLVFLPSYIVPLLVLSGIAFTAAAMFIVTIFNRRGPDYGKPKE